MPIEIGEILSYVSNGLAHHTELLDQEHAVRGLDALSEIQLHALIADALTPEPIGIHREVHYPSDGDAYTSRTHRDRCDLVLTPNPDLLLSDPVTELQLLAAAQDTLFANNPALQPDPTTTCQPEDALWIEIKACAQYAYRDGVPTPNGRYAHELVNGLQTDLCKLSADPHIWHAAALTVLFTETEEIAMQDLHAAAKLCIEQDIPVRSPLIETISITDRAGNACLGLGMFPISI